MSTEPHQPVSVNPLGARERARRVYHWVPGAELAADARVAAIATVAAEQDRLRRAWLNPEGADEATLKKRTLTNLYNARPPGLSTLTPPSTTPSGPPTAGMIRPQRRWGRMSSWRGCGR